MSVRGREGIFAGAGAGVMLIVLLVLQSMIGSGLLGARTVTSTTTGSVSTVPVAYAEVNSAYGNHLLFLDSRNYSAFVGGYEGNATVEWTGVIAGAVGNYTGAANIRILYSSFVGKFLNFSVSDDSQAIAPEGNYWLVNSTFDLHAYSTIEGRAFAAIAAQDSYVRVGGAWLIARETWNFTQFNPQYPVLTG